MVDSLELIDECLHEPVVIGTLQEIEMVSFVSDNLGLWVDHGLMLKSGRLWADHVTVARYKSHGNLCDTVQRNQIGLFRQRLWCYKFSMPFKFGLFNSSFSLVSILLEATSERVHAPVLLRFDGLTLSAALWIPLMTDFFREVVAHGLRVCCPIGPVDSNDSIFRELHERRIEKLLILAKLIAVLNETGC